MTIEQGATLAASLAAGAAGLGFIGKRLGQFARRLLELTDVILGNEQTGQSSLADRLSALECDQKSTHEHLQALKHELHPNSGLSLRDAIDRTEQLVGDVQIEMRRNARAARARRSEDRRALRELSDTVHNLMGGTS